MNKLVISAIVAGVAVLAVVLFFVFRKHEKKQDKDLPAFTAGTQSEPYMFNTSVGLSGLYSCQLDKDYKCPPSSQYPCPYQMFDDNTRGNWRWSAVTDSSGQVTKCLPPPDGSPGDLPEKLPYGPKYYLTSQA